MVPAWWQQVPGSERRSGQLWGNPTPYQGSKKSSPREGGRARNPPAWGGEVFKPTYGQSKVTLPYPQKAGRNPRPGKGEIGGNKELSQNP